MMSATRKRELLREAYSLAGDLHDGQVGRSEWSTVLDALYRQHQALAEVRELVGFLAGSAMAQRSDRTRNQFRHLATTFEQFWALRIAPEDAAQRLSVGELRFTFGWADRFLHVYEAGIPVPELAREVRRR